MTLYEFKLLDLDKRAQAAWDQGEHVATRTTSKYKILLWTLEDFYVEMFYNYIDDKIMRVRAFRNLELVERYLDQIDISDIYK